MPIRNPYIDNIAAKASGEEYEEEVSDIAQFLDHDDDIEINNIQHHENHFYVDHAAEAADTQEQVADIAQ